MIEDKEVKADSKTFKLLITPADKKTETKLLTNKPADNKPEEKNPQQEDKSSSKQPDLKEDILIGSRPQYKIDWQKHKTVELIEIKVKKINQLFNSFDPSPFLEKDLDDDAFEYIVSAVGEHHIKVKQKIVIYVPKYEKRKISEAEIVRAIHHFFEYKKTLAERSIKLKLQEGQVSLIIGIIFLAGCLLVRELIMRDSEGLFMNILSEGLIIGGWVAMWKPISELLYEWWPLIKEKNIYEKISKMEVDLKYI